MDRGCIDQLFAIRVRQTDRHKHVYTHAKHCTNHIHTNPPTQVHTHTAQIQTYTHMYTNTHTHMYTHTYTHAYTQKHTFTNTQIQHTQNEHILNRMHTDTAQKHTYMHTWKHIVTHVHRHTHYFPLCICSSQHYWLHHMLDKQLP